MAELRFLSCPSLPIPELTTALHDHLLSNLSATRSTSDLGWLVVYQVRGDVISLGRYHFAPARLDDSAVKLNRRLSGGRVAAFGDGFVGISLLLPHPAALVSDQRDALKPEQIPNRYVRGILEALRLASVDAPYYPGRDLIHAGQRIVGVLSFTVSASGALLFDVLLAVDRDLSASIELLDRSDRDGVIKMQMIPPDMATSLSELIPRPSFEQVAQMVRVGFERQFGVSCRPEQLGDQQWAQVAGQANLTFGDQWLAQRQSNPSRMRALQADQLGMVEIQLTVDRDNRIDEVMIGGDVLANERAIDALERGLCGCIRSRSEVGTVVAQVLGEPGNFVLGTNASAIVDLVLAAV